MHRDLVRVPSVRATKVIAIRLIKIWDRCLFQVGPVQVYMAKAPGTAAAFDGSGTAWTKVYSLGLVNSTTWATDLVNANSGKHSFIIPKSIPSGEYLIRKQPT